MDQTYSAANPQNKTEGKDNNINQNDMFQADGVGQIECEIT